MKKSIAYTVDSLDLGRRHFLFLGVQAMLTVMFWKPAFCAPQSIYPAKKKLSFYNTHTGEFLTTCYWCDGKYIRDSLQEIDNIFRDHRTNQKKRIDKKLIDLLFSLKENMGTDKPFHIISGYRSPETNAMLRRRNGSQVAKRSLHIEGKAVDIRVPECSIKDLQKAAVKLGVGGVGYYPKSRFVHVDVGRVRYW